MRRRSVQLILLCYLFFCIYLVTFAGINLKEVQNENWFIGANYMVGLVLCLPMSILVGLLPENWELSTFQLNLILAIVTGVLAAVFVFYAQILECFENKRQR